jgi:hypothetical protein
MLVGLSLGSVGLIALACAYGIDRACYHAGAPVRIAEIGTPRGSYCARIEDLHRWWFLIGTPLVLTVVALAATWRRKRPALILTGLIVLATIANLVVVNQMEWAHTI